MAFDEIRENLDQIRKEAGAYVDSSLKYYKLWGFKVAMKSTTMMIKIMLIVLCGLMVLLFVSLAGALALGVFLENMALGFLIVGGVYLAGMLLLFLVKDKIVEGPILRRFSEIFFNE